MGINGLWHVSAAGCKVDHPTDVTQLFSSVSQHILLQQLAVEDGFLKHPSFRGYCVGIDIR
jgi:hypothetical protein